MMKFKPCFCYRLCLIVSPKGLQVLPVQWDLMDSPLIKFEISFLARVSEERVLGSHLVNCFLNQCPNDKQVNIVEGSVSDEEVLLTCCAESSVNSWVMDSGASFHVTHSSEALQNLVIGDFRKLRLADPELLRKVLISVRQLDEQGHEVKFRDGLWKVVKGKSCHGPRKEERFAVYGSDSACLWEPVGTEDESRADFAVIDVLELERASTGLLVV
ncbi:unnamed protein product [Cuscuta campestris]|uniref:Uncharacterized protein n=1 Tax=Cuscuta campestris TaxID=132261 RepID=A0A484K4N0_9ASTE|nr:unnamed protein product [Cuscuta campestris]